MARTAGYQTKQRTALIAYLEGMKGRHLTAKAVCEGLEGTGVKIGAATVYRQLEKLVDEGLARKYTVSATDPACFEYIGTDRSCTAEHCFHCVCTSCGKLYHVECDHLAEIAEHLKSDHGFAIDPQRTVFYGTCDACGTAR